MNLLKTLEEKAKKLNKRIVFPEFDDVRVLKAASMLSKKKIVKPIIIGDKKIVQSIAKKNRINLQRVEIIEPDNKYTEKLFKIRKNKGLTLIDAKNLLKEPIYYAVMMVNEGDADGVVSGASHPTAHTLKPAFQILKTDVIASSHMLIINKGKTYLFADCAVNPKPTSEELAQIAISTAQSAKLYKLKPRVAMLSFSTKGSAKHEEVDRVVAATNIVKNKKPNLIIDGELQVDAALVPDVAKMKAPNSPIKGDANILIFPDLGAGNIGHKLVERIGGAKAIGPIIQGLRKPVNDLSRGCSVNDIIMVAVITAIQSQKN
ncbi:MAG: phosphate acetyltransferase [Nanoarchaeota archaeon]|nr:phosphate acetyltransferase [Nanoarchaeota archaeon]MBU1270065.1 phosphate acetyltransferase [Nanoarchaeota archaeon]MBU1605006.1 phosphate acetyltransferase [Nanoarchaeota archaeon]MBU2443401.1 phosphate acetyltransferase [Nanoarchaeota archaeon]